MHPTTSDSIRRRDETQRGWETIGRRRRSALLTLTILPSLFAAYLMHGLLPVHENTLLKWTLTVLFGILFAWVTMGFWSALAGLAVSLLRYTRFSPIEGLPARPTLPKTTRAAILFPVYNEDSRKVVEGVRTVWQSLRRLGVDDNFDLFILSDSTNPDAWVREEEAWHDLTATEDALGRIFYRHRKINRKGKSGNVADFCRRWGANYPYMIVFDADSLMSGETLVRMVQAMEAHPGIGILQTAPKSINSLSLISRLQQFSNHLYGPMFAAGLHYWQLGDAQYWGHNAIIRIEPFMRYCHLPVLSGPKPLGGNILSHDFVEAALMRRAGYGVWLAAGLEGSFEENPPSLIDELVRDRRWCQGNLQHSRLILARGFFPTHRALFINGIMSYGSALLWLFFLLVSSLQAVMDLLAVPNYFPTGPSLFPDWPKYFTNWTLGLFGGTAALLFLPKIFMVLVVVAKGGAAQFGGAFALSLSFIFELLVSALLAPVRMLFHSVFVVTTLAGFTVRWNAQNRDSRGTAWLEALRVHWWGTLLGLVWGWFMYVIDPGFFLWLSPIVLGLVLSTPLSVWTSRVGLGERLLRLGLFLTPAETNPSLELIALARNLAVPDHHSPFALAREAGFLRAVVIPRVFALHATLNANKRTILPKKREDLQKLVEKAVEGGPETLSAAEKKLLLGEPEFLGVLHHRVWALDNAAAAKWGIR